jgi:3-oxoadipate enol-lactonase
VVYSPGVDLPTGTALTLPGRGRTFVREVPGPPGTPTLVLLHGLGATAAVNWFACFEELGRHYRVLALDHRGHGQGIRPGLRGFRLKDCADDVAALGDLLGVERMVAVGYSMGGPIAQLLWRQHPTRVAGLVLCATARSFRGAGRAQLMLDTSLTTAAAAMRLAPGAVRRQVLRAGLNRRLAAQGVLPEDIAAFLAAELGGHDPAALIEATRELGRFSSGPWLGSVTVPTAVVVTTLDGVVPPDRQERLAESIPGARVFRVAGDHGVCATDAPSFVPVLLDACRWVAPTGG